MKPSIVHLLLGLCWIMTSTSAHALAYYGGDGSYQNPYQLATAEDLIELDQSTWDYDKHFVLVQDIDLEGYFFSESIIASSGDLAGYTVGTEGFQGTFNGNGHVICNLKISGEDYLGLFGGLGDTAVVTQLGIVDANLIGTSKYVGLIAGVNSGTISRCFGTGVVQGESRVGGLVGFNLGSMSNCYSQVNVTGVTLVGGLIGRTLFDYHDNCMLSHCYSAGILYAEESYGGLVGRIDHYEQSFWDAEISGVSGDSGLSTEQMMDANTFEEAGWDFVGEDENGSYDLWTMPTDGGYPVLSVFEGLSCPWPDDSGVHLGLCTLSEDSNEVVWDADERFSSQWSSVSLIESLHTSLDSNVLHSDVSIAIAGQLESVASDSLLGLDLENVVTCQALDVDGNSIALDNVIGPFELWHPWRLMPSGVQTFDLNLQLAATQSIPTGLSQVDFLFDGLYANPLMVVELPFSVMDEWLEIATGMTTRITEAQFVYDEEEVCQFTIQVQAEDGTLNFNALGENRSLADDEREIPEEDDFLINIDLIDSDGEVVERTSGTTHMGVSNSSNLTYSGAWKNCTDVQVIRYTIAVQPTRRIIPLTLYDIPIVTD